MSRSALALVLAVALVSPALAGGTLAGNWKVTIFESEREFTLWMITLKEADGKLQATAEPNEGVPPATVVDLKKERDVLSFTLQLEAQKLSFEFVVPKEVGTVLRGSAMRPRLTNPAFLERTKATGLGDKVTLLRETLERHPGTPRAARAAIELVAEGATRDAAAADVREWANLAFKLGEPYGPRWQRYVTHRMAEALAGKKAYGELALKVLNKARELQEPGAGKDGDLQLLEALARTYRALGRNEEATKLQAEIDRVEVGSYKEYMGKPAGFQLKEIKGRKGTRTVLVELFTGAQCPPCVAADLAFDALEKTYKPSEVVLLQYHLHIPRQDALANKDTEARQEYYGEKVAGTPSIMFNGEPKAPGGGRAGDAGDKYTEYLKVIEPLLEQPAKVQLQASATRKEEKVSIAVKVSDLDKPGAKVKLRLALVEEWVRYSGSNGLPYHHRVVRALPGGANGFALPEKTHEQKVEVNLEQLRTSIQKYLDEVARDLGPFPDQQRPLAFRNLRVVAFVQDDATREVLQAVEVEVKE